jgi:hypothetical protein
MIDLNPSATTLADEASAAYLGQWNRLVSTTNWEKGRIIGQWRQALSAAAPASEYADEAWSRRVGNVSGQHVGRLRRVYERFDASREQYPPLYWSHFQAALDWDDAEMWLEGAARSGWSVAEMRRHRWETLGAIESGRPSDDEIVSGEMDEDFDSIAEGTLRVAEGTQPESSSAEKNSRTDQAAESVADRGPPGEWGEEIPSAVDDAEDSPKPAARRPFAHLVELPDDLSEAFETFKLAIVRHKLAGWQAVSREDVLTALDALRELALAPAE